MRSDAVTTGAADCSARSGLSRSSNHSTALTSSCDKSWRREIGMLSVASSMPASLTDLGEPETRSRCESLARGMPIPTPVGLVPDGLDHLSIDGVNWREDQQARNLVAALQAATGYRWALASPSFPRSRRSRWTSYGAFDGAIRRPGVTWDRGAFVRPSAGREIQGLPPGSLAKLRRGGSEDIRRVGTRNGLGVE